MGVYCRTVLIALICSGMLILPVESSLGAAPAVPTGQGGAVPFAVIVSADLARVGVANAAGGTTVYPGDSLDTGAGGVLRLTVAGGQVYLLSDTGVRIGNSGLVLQATLTRGTIGFSSLTDRQFQILVPEGLVEAAYGQPAYGQVTITGPDDVVISAYSGALVLHRGDQTLIVRAGQSYYVSLVPDDAPPQRRAGVVPAYNNHLVWRLIVITAAGLTAYFLWRSYSLSPFSPSAPPVP